MLEPNGTWNLGKYDNTDSLSVEAIERNSNNVYCIEQGQVLTNNMTYDRVAKIIIKGWKATFYDKNGNEVGKTDHYVNNKIAAILTPNNYIPWWPDECFRYRSYTVGYNRTVDQRNDWILNDPSLTMEEKYEKMYSDAQLALYQYLRTWLTANWGGGPSAKDYLAQCGVNTSRLSGVSTSLGQIRYEESSTLNDNFDFYMEIHILKHRLNKYQYLLAAYPDKVVEKGKATIDISVNKNWNDSNNAYNTRPGSITVQLYRNGSYTGKSITLNNANGWKGTFTELESGTGYSIKEVNEPTGYTVQYSGSQDNGFTITNTLKTTNITVKKNWNDENNRDGKRPGTVLIKLYANGQDTGQKAMVSTETNPAWTYTFTNLPQYMNGSKVNYTVQEENIDGYTPSYSGEGTSNITITNTHVPERTQVAVTKEWNDMDDLDDLRPSSITVTLYKNGTSTGQTLTLSSSNNWTGTFTNLYKYENGKIIDYTVKENTISDYTVQINKNESTDGNISYTIKNTHEPHYDGYVEITGKAWLDGEGGKENVLNGVFGDDVDTVLSGVNVILKDKNGNAIKSTYTDENGKFTRTDYAITDKDGNYTIRVNYDNSQNVYKLYEDINNVKNKLKTAYVEFEYDGMKYTTVAPANSGENTSKAKEDETARNKFDSNHSEVTPKTTNPEEWTDRYITANTKEIILSFEEYKDIANKKSNEIIKYCNGNGTYKHTNHNNAWENIITGNHSCPNCTGTGHSMRTFDVDVYVIQNVNLGLFKREQPDVAIFSDIKKVEVKMNKQKYTYMYGVRSDVYNPEDADYVQTKFQKKDTYTYQRPVNPADIAYLKEVNKNAMEVYVTYEITIGNLSNTLTVSVESIINDYDSNYKIKYSEGENSTERYHITYGTIDDKGVIRGTPLEENQISSPVNKGEYSEIVLSGLGIEVAKQSESKNKLYIRYQISQEKLPELFNENTPPLNNTVEIKSYSTVYGEDTLYAEQRPKITDGNRTGKPYGGYDYDSHPGNANIQLATGEDGVIRLYSTDQNGNIIPTDKMEDDTDIAPSFALCKDEPKTLAGTVWEDLDESGNGNERLGNGKIDDREKNVENVRVELYNLNGERAKLYDNSTKLLNKDAIVYTEPDGSYKLEGVVTGEYYLKFSYGDDTTKLKHEATTMDGGTTKVNARNYKSTIITDDKIKNVLKKDYENFSEEEKKWHITHSDGYSVAVDDMKERVKIPDLQYSNFNEHYVEPQNMTSYTKPFKTQVEFETTGTSKVETTQEEKDQKDILGNISTDNVLSKLDFGISERPRENLYIQKTISYIKLELANGQIITEGDPRTEDLSYVKAMGFGQVIDSAVAARNAIEKQLLIELDSELIQGARLEIQYEVIVKNDNEIDYDYGNEENYSDINDNNHITKSSKANYYFYGDHRDLEEMKASIEFVDYLDSEVSYNEESNTDWTSPKNISDLKINGLVSQEVVSFIESNKYKVLQSNIEGAFDGKVTLGRGESSEAVKMSVNKLLTSQSENVYDNGAEIIKIDGKTARTIQESDEGVQIEKEYKPGNYIPSAESEKLEQDDDRVKVIITPPTGTTKYVATYIVTILAGLIVIITGIVFIKKKILIK